MNGRHKWDGTISERDFLEACRTFPQRWSEADPSNPPWMWVSHPVVSGFAQEIGYLALENVCHQKSIENLLLTGLDGCSSDEDPGIDGATLVKNPDSRTHLYDYHILYSFSYNVPMLYFRGYQYDGQQLQLEEIMADFSLSSSIGSLTESTWTFITTEDHPFLHRPWHMLHPCATRDWMSLLFSDSSPLLDCRQTVIQKHYLPSWLSVVGQVVGLKIPLGLHAHVNIPSLTMKDL
ncbi:autophagocytosis-associated family protein isoform X2 [Wolffia australiana]